MQVIKAETGKTRYFIAEHIAEFWTEQLRGQWHVRVRLVGVAITGRDVDGDDGSRTFSAHETEEEAISSAEQLAVRLSPNTFGQ